MLFFFVLFWLDAIDDIFVNTLFRLNKKQQKEEKKKQEKLKKLEQQREEERKKREEVRAKNMAECLKTFKVLHHVHA